MSQFNPYESPSPQPPGYGPPNPNQTPLILAIGSLATAILGIGVCVCCMIPPLSVLSIVLGGVALYMNPDQNAKIMAIIGMSLSGLTIMAWIAMMILAVAVDASRVVQ